MEDMVNRTRVEGGGYSKSTILLRGCNNIVDVLLYQSSLRSRAS